MRKADKREKPKEEKEREEIQMRTVETNKEARAKMLPLQINRVVVALCGDYERRQREIEKQTADEKTIEHYRFLNQVIDSALEEECEEGIRKKLREDIGNGVGHRRTQLYYMAAGTYKTRKRNCKYRIAKKLNLV